MKVKVIEAVVSVSYTEVRFRGINKEVVEKEVADVCRKDWDHNEWEHWWKADPVKMAKELDPFSLGPPNIPTDDAEVIRMYFFRPDAQADDDHWIAWGEFELDISPPDIVDLSVERHFSVERSKPCHTGSSYLGAAAATHGSLGDEGDTDADALECFILSLTAIGFPVHLPQFKEALRDSMEHLSNR